MRTNGAAQQRSQTDGMTKVAWTDLLSPPTKKKNDEEREKETKKDDEDKVITFKFLNKVLVQMFAYFVSIFNVWISIRLQRFIF